MMKTALDDSYVTSRQIIFENWECYFSFTQFVTSLMQQCMLLLFRLLLLRGSPQVQKQIFRIPANVFLENKQKNMIINPFAILALLPTNYPPTHLVAPFRQ